MVAMGVLLLSHFPPPGSTLLEEGAEEVDETTEQ